MGWIETMIKDLLQSRYWKRKGVKLSAGSRLKAKTVIGFGTRVNGKLLTKGSSSCRIGRYCAIGADVKIITSNHKISHANLQCSLQNKLEAQDLEYTLGDVEIANNVWIGDSVTILTGVNVGNGAVIGANAVVTRNVPPYAVVAGCPAKAIRFRFDKHIFNQLETIAWWNWPQDKIMRNKAFFDLDLTSLDPATDLTSFIK